MHLTRKSKILVAGLAAAAGATIATGSAFTAGGITNSTTDGFVGGTFTQVITGATVTNIAYATTGNTIDSVTVTFDDGANENLNDSVLRIQFQTTADANIGTYTCTIEEYVGTCAGSVKVLSTAAEKLIVTVSET